MEEKILNHKNLLQCNGCNMRQTSKSRQGVKVDLLSKNSTEKAIIRKRYIFHIYCPKKRLASKKANISLIKKWAVSLNSFSETWSFLKADALNMILIIITNIVCSTIILPQMVLPDQILSGVKTTWTLDSKDESDNLLINRRRRWIE